MSTTSKNNLYILIAIVVAVLLIFFLYKGINYGSTASPSQSPGATSTDVAYNGAGGSNQNTVAGTSGAGKTYTYTGSNISGSNAATPNLNNLAVLTTVIGNSLVHVPQAGTDVALSAGTASYPDTSGQIAGQISAGRILGWVETSDASYDVFTDMTVTKTNQPQVLHYVALFNVTSLTRVTFTSAVLIGDRLPITSVVATPDKSKSINPSSTIMSTTLGYILTVNYMDRKNGEPLTAVPSLAKSVILNVLNHIVSQ